MSAGNAFAAQQTGNGHGEDCQNGGPRPSKRARLSKPAVSGTWMPCTQAATALEVDIMILDHTTFQGIGSCLDSRKTSDTIHGPAGSTGALGRNLQLAGSFMSIFKARYPTYKPDAELRLRVLLLRLSTLFTQRCSKSPATPDRDSLHHTRKINRERAEVWIVAAPERRPSALSGQSAFVRSEPINSHHLERNRAHVLHQLGMPAEDEDYEDAFYGTSSCVSLLDLLPLFIEVSAASSSIHGSNLTPRWMQLACEFMLQACLEQYLVCGAYGTDIVDEAFAWGYQTADTAAREAVGEQQDQRAEVNEMFEDETYSTEVEGWSVLKEEYVHELTNVDDDANMHVDMASHLKTVASKHPVAEFEALILKFLEALSHSIADPVLAQLERGNLDGMTKAETQRFLADCGVSSG